MLIETGYQTTEELAWYAFGMPYLVGIDEAGRGPIAGPVSVGVVRVHTDFDLLSAFPGLNDSKKLSEKKREAIFLRLQEEMQSGNVEAIVLLSSAEKIDAKGIVPSIRGALEKGLRTLHANPLDGKVFLDGSLKAPDEYEQETVIGGDGVVPAIMLASIAAKVTRDRYMKKIAEDYPAYGFEIHKGYGTKLHYERLRAYGPCVLHRRSFLKSLI